MGEERAECVDVAERAAEPAVETGARRLAVVLEQVQVVPVAELANAIERGRIAQYADRDHHARARRQGGLELRYVEIERVELDVDEAQLETVLLQRMVRRRPRQRRHNDFVAALQRAFALMKKRGDADEIRGRSRVHHDGVP